MQKSSRGFFAGSQIQKAAPGRLLPQCGACGLFRTCESPKIGVYGDGEAKVLFVGEAPGKDEDEQGRPFVGKSGQHLRRVLRSIKFDLDEDAWTTNALICRPPKNRKPTAAEVVYCRPNLNDVIKKLKPDVIIPMGGAAVESVLGEVWKESVGPISKWVGWRIPSHALNAWVCPTWHPSFIMLEDDEVLNDQFKRHLAAATHMFGKPWPDGVPDWNKCVKRILNPDEAARALQQIMELEGGAIAWDYETNMLKPDGSDARIISCAVAWGKEEPEICIAYPWHGAAIEATGKLLRSLVPKIASNLKFEDRWTRKTFGHRVRNWAWDTMVAAHVADNRPGITSVKFQGFVRLGVPVWNEKVEPFLRPKGSDTVNRILQEIDIKDLLLYNGLDAFLEFKVAVNQMREIGYTIPWRI